MPIERAELRERQAGFAARLADAGLPGAVVASRGGGTFDRHGNVFYLTGHYQPYVYLPENPPRWSGRSHTVAVVRADGSTVLCVSVPDAYRESVTADDVRVGGDFVKVVASTVRDLGLAEGALGIVGLDALPGNLWDGLRDATPGVAYSGVDELLGALRRRKSLAERAAIREACAMGRRAVSAYLDALEPGASEADAVAAAVAEVARSGGGIYMPASSSGPRVDLYAADALTGFGTRGLAEGDMVRFDLVAQLDGYLTDFGRTTVVGEPSDDQRRLLDALHGGIDAAIGTLAPGVPVKDVVAAGNAALVEVGVALEPADGADLVAAYPPHWGHGLGVGWERPWFVEDEELAIEDEMYLAIERCLRMPGVGSAAAEQDLLVEDGRVELLTGGPRGEWT